MVPRWLKLVCMAFPELRWQGCAFVVRVLSSPPDGGLPLVGVKVVPPRRCAAARAPSGLLRRGIRAGRYEEGCGGVVGRERLSGMIFTQPEAGQRSPRSVCGIGAVCGAGR
jgi:hypothetical protein